MVHSKIQLRILDLYKRYLIAIKNHPESYRNYIRDSFKDGAKKYEKTNFFVIEHQLARGERKLAELPTHNISGFSKTTIEKK
uniref:Mitochondrial zinc maintenance protein 1, mitochondrial n=1 Tax=Parastrongyloides trichosuri TaxID=131310 RepID=A0A0N5A5A3_PARTI